jgi:hypothetical protein
VNVYEVEFFARCPANDLRIKYSLRIETMRVIRVEELLASVEGLTTFHEDLADSLHFRFKGSQTLRAEHHGVTITTTRTE